MNIKHFKLILLFLFFNTVSTNCIGQSNASKISSFTYQSVLGCKNKDCGNEELRTGMIVLDLSKKKIVLTSSIAASTEGIIYSIEKNSMQQFSGREVLRIDAIDSDKGKTIFMIYKSDNSSSDFTLKSKYSSINTVIMCYEVSSGKTYYFYCK